MSLSTVARLIALLPLVLCACASPIELPPNVLFVVVDDLRLNVDDPNRPITPSIDELASEGVRFTQSYVNVPVCGASRASILTGLRPMPDRFVNYFTRVDNDAPDAVTLPEHFKNNGYETFAFGKVYHDFDDAERSWSVPVWHPNHIDSLRNTTWRDYQIEENAVRDAATGDGPTTESVDVPDDAYYDGMVANQASRELTRLSASGEPFFMAVGFVKPHLPFNAPTKYWDQYDPSTIELAEFDEMPEGAPSNAWHPSGEIRWYGDIPAAPATIPDSLARHLIHGYLAATSYADAQLGRVLSKLEELELADNTIVVLLGDHGWSLGEHGLWCKHSTFDVAVRAPLFFRGPGVTENAASDGLVEFVDIYPTLVELAGLPAPNHLQGESLGRRLADPTLPGKDAVFPRYHSAEAVKTDRFLYTAWFNPEESEVQEMLYDHISDPDETVNLISDPRYAADAAHHRDLLAEAMATRK